MEPLNPLAPATPAGDAHPAACEGIALECWRVRRVAHYLDVSPKRIYQMVQENKLAAIRISPRNMRILRHSVEEYLAGRLAASHVAPDE